MGVLEKYKLLSTGKAFGNRAQIALALLDSKTAYEELKEEAAQSMVAGSYSCEGGDPSVILEKIAIEMICRDTRNTWYLPDTVKFWDRRFGGLLEAKFFVMTMMRKLGVKFYINTLSNYNGCQNEKIIVPPEVTTMFGDSLRKF